MQWGLEGENTLTTKLCNLRVNGGKCVFLKATERRGGPLTGPFNLRVCSQDWDSGGNGVWEGGIIQKRIMAKCAAI